MRERVAVVVVNWNTRELLRECLHAIIGSDEPAALRVVCVDNGSCDGSAAMVRAEFPTAVLLENRENRGFAAACNQGIARALEADAADYVALVNSDVVVQAPTIRALVARLAAAPDVGAVGPALRLPDGRLQVGAAGYAFTGWTGICQFLFLAALTRGRLHGFFLDQRHVAGRARPVVVDWVSGACLVARADAIRATGPLDARLFMYAEDVEWCRRMGRRGFRVWYLPQLEVLHRHGASSAGANPRWLASACALVRRERGAGEYAVFRAAAAAGLSARRLGYTVAYAASRRPRYRKLAADMRVYAAWALGRDAGGV